MSSTVVVHASDDSGQREPECREEECFRGVFERLVERTRIHDETSCNGRAEDDKQYEIENVYYSSNGHESREFVWLDRQESCKTSRGHCQGKPSPGETRLWLETYTNVRISLSALTALVAP